MVTTAQKKKSRPKSGPYWSLISWDSGRLKIEGNLDRSLVSNLLRLKGDAPNLEIVLCCEYPGKSLYVEMEEGIIHKNKFKSKISKIVVKGKGKDYHKKRAIALVVSPYKQTRHDWGEFSKKTWEAWGTGVWGEVVNVKYKRKEEEEIQNNPSLTDYLAVGVYDNKSKISASQKTPGLSHVRIEDEKKEKFEQILGSVAVPKLKLITTALSRSMMKLAPIFRSELCTDDPYTFLTAYTKSNNLCIYGGQFSDWNMITFCEPPLIDAHLMSSLMTALGCYINYELSSLDGYERPASELKLKASVNVLRNKVPDPKKIYKQHALLIGATNVGKTTLVNTFTSEKDILIPTTIGVELRDMRIKLDSYNLDKYASCVSSNKMEKTQKLIKQGKNEIGILTRDVGGQDPSWMYHTLPTVPYHSPWWVGLAISSKPDEYKDSLQFLDRRIPRISNFHYLDHKHYKKFLPWDSYPKYIFMTKTDLENRVELSAEDKSELLQRYEASKLLEINKYDSESVKKAIYTASLNSL